MEVSFFKENGCITWSFISIYGIQHSLPYLYTEVVSPRNIFQRQEELV